MNELLNYTNTDEPMMMIHADDAEYVNINIQYTFRVFKKNCIMEN